MGKFNPDNILSKEYWATAKFGKLRMLDPINISPGSSHKKILWLCDCGKITERPVWYVSHGKMTSCTKCNWKDKSYWKSNKFGSLKMKDPIEINIGSKKKVDWTCDCGKIRNCKITSVTGGNITTCGKCDWEDMKFWSDMKFGKLKLKSPKFMHKRSYRKELWICDCGNDTMVHVGRVTTGVTSSCGKCSDIDLTTSITFGKLRVKVPTTIQPYSTRKLVWICDCGRETSPETGHVFSGATTSCGQCNIRTAQEWVNMKFGSLRLKDPIDIHPASSKKVEWLCDCGQTTEIVVSVVTRNNGTKSCGKCYDKALDWYKTNKKILLNLQLPIHPNEIPPGWIKINDVIVRNHDKMASVCGACKSTYYPLWNDVRQGRSMTCGCATFRISSACKEIGAFINECGFTAIYEHKVGRYKYDIFIPEVNLLIEFNGLRWHSYPDSKLRDITKYNMALRCGFTYLCIFEDEWNSDPIWIKHLIKQKLDVLDPLDLKDCSVRTESSEAIYKHLIYHENRLIAHILFTKTSDGWNFSYHYYSCEYTTMGSMLELLQNFIKQHGMITSISDNRYSISHVYELLGFSMTESLESDYYWTRRHKRFPKDIENQTQGLRKIWDLGKTRWITRV